MSAPVRCRLSFPLQCLPIYDKLRLKSYLVGLVEGPALTRSSCRHSRATVPMRLRPAILPKARLVMKYSEKGAQSTNRLILTDNIDRDLLSRHQRISHADGNEHYADVPDRDPGELRAQPALEASASTYPPVDDNLQGESQQRESSSQHVSPGIADSQIVRDDAFHQRNDWSLHDPGASFPEPFQDQLTQDLLAGMDDLDFDFLFNDNQFLTALPAIEPLEVSQPENGQMIPQVIPESHGRVHSPKAQDQADRPEGRPKSCLGSRLPSMEPEKPEVMPLHVEPAHDHRSHSQQAPTLRQVHSIRPWKISPEEYSQILNNFENVRSLSSTTCVSPSRHGLTRFLEGYFRGFAIHMPFLHPVTFSAASVSPGLILSMCAVGALYRFQPVMGYQLYADAQALISWRLRDRSRAALVRLTDHSSGRPGAVTGTEVDALHLLQSMIIIMAMASWGDHGLTQDALSMSSGVATLARDLMISVPEEAPPPNQKWSDGIKHEERRRTVFAAYTLLNLQSVAFNVPPLLLTQEIAINLPGCASSWQAQNSAEWSTLRDTYMTPKPFRETVNDLISGKTIHIEAAVSSFGNYVLIHGLLQQVFLARNATGCLPDAYGFSCASLVDRIQNALRAWQESWEATYESTTDPSSPKGPMGFNSTAILRLVYIRLSADFGPSRQLLFAREPGAIVEAFYSRRAIKAEDRSPRLDRAVLQCTHALSIPVRVGIEFVARTQTINWGVEHVLCNLECAFLSAQWLIVLSECVEASGVDTLRADERRLVNVIVSLIRETELGDSFDEDSHSYALHIRGLASSIMTLWAQIYKGSHVLDIVQLIGSGLEMLAETLRSNGLDHQHIQ